MPEAATQVEIQDTYRSVYTQCGETSGLVASVIIEYKPLKELTARARVGANGKSKGRSQPRQETREETRYVHIGGKHNKNKDPTTSEMRGDRQSPTNGRNGNRRRR